MADPKLTALADHMASADASEFGNAQLYLTKLTEALGVPTPGFAGSGYEFEYKVRVVHRDGSDSINRVDLFKQNCFLLEAKHAAESSNAELVLRRAFGQAATYAAFVPGGPPPYLMVLDVGRTLRVWDRWSGAYGGWQGAVRTIDLPTLGERSDDVEFLRAVWTRPESLDPNARAAAVTKDIAAKLAALAAQLEARGHDQEIVARFLIRCVFTMFAEDVGLLADEPFRRIVQNGVDDPLTFEDAVHRLWQAMDVGDAYGPNRLLRFNGHFFADQRTISLTRDDLRVLHEASRADWRDVEPSIFGTLLTRALDREERHRLGAEFTPRAYVERLVRPTIEEPVRERWTLVQAEVLQLKERDTRQGREAAVRRLRQFLEYLRSIRVLDPACGSGNFLYVALSILKEIELEAVREIESITGQPELTVEQVGPRQFHGIEIKPWAREVAELCLWVGHHQWWRRTHGHTQPPEPVLEDTGTLECRDAVLAWDEIVHRPEKDRPDPTPRIPHPVTGELVPDPEAKLPYHEYVGARQAEWPQADFIVGNPPYMGNKRMREAFGDGYVDALRSAYPRMTESADYVMYWWMRAARAVACGDVRRAGLITTRSIADSQNRAFVMQASEEGAHILLAIPDHPWVDESDAADVWVAMTVLSTSQGSATRVEVDSRGKVIRSMVGDRLNADLTLHADVAQAIRTPLKANGLISGRGVSLVGAGFIVDEEEARRLFAGGVSPEILRPYWRGTDVAKRPRTVFVLDFGMKDLAHAREHPVLFDLARDRIWPDRQGNNRASYREFWWRFGEPRGTFRQVLAGLGRYIATTYVGKHRIFRFVSGDVVPDGGLIAIGSDDPAHLGVLSSRVHMEWALASGGIQGVGHTPRYNNSLIFDSFPFPEPSATQRAVIATIAESLDDHRKAALARDESVTMTGMYNVVEKLRSGEALTAKERKIHEIAACGVLRDLHDELDAAVAAAYGWPWPMETEEILERLVALHDERVEEEKRGLVRWLRPDYQIPRFGERVPASLELEQDEVETTLVATEVVDWPADAIEQLTAIRSVVADHALTVEEVARRFRGARRADVAKHLETLEVLGAVAQLAGERYQVQATPQAVAA